MDNEQTQTRYSRAFRRHHANTAFLRQSPCLPDIHLGLLRRVCLKLGVSTVGDKVRLLASIQVRRGRSMVLRGGDTFLRGKH